MLAQVRAHASPGGISDSDESRHDIGIGSRNHWGRARPVPDCALLVDGRGTKRGVNLCVHPISAHAAGVLDRLGIDEKTWLAHMRPKRQRQPIALGALDKLKAGAPVFAGTPGSVGKRKNQHGLEYHVHRFYDGSGKQREVYLGRVGEADARADDLRQQIREVKALMPDVRLLMGEGFQAVDSLTYATLASLHLYGLFQAGALAFERLPEKTFLEMLRDSGIHFIEVHQLDSRLPSSSFKMQGKSRFHVDLLAPELKAHATTLPYLAYLLGESQVATLLASEGVCPVRVPVAERFALHKLVISQLHSIA